MSEKRTISLAYGSNLNMVDMKKRCPDGEVIGKGILSDYRLLFKGEEKNAFLTIEKRKGPQFRWVSGDSLLKMKSLWTSMKSIRSCMTRWTCP